MAPAIRSISGTGQTGPRLVALCRAGHRHLSLFDQHCRDTSMLRLWRASPYAGPRSPSARAGHRQRGKAETAGTAGQRRTACAKGCVTGRTRGAGLEPASTAPLWRASLPIGPHHARAKLAMPGEAAAHRRSEGGHQNGEPCCLSLSRGLPVRSGQARCPDFEQRDRLGRCLLPQKPQVGEVPDAAGTQVMGVVGGLQVRAQGPAQSVQFDSRPANPVDASHPVAPMLPGRSSLQFF